MNRQHFTLLFPVVFVSFFVACAGYGEALVEMFSPQGSAKGVRQVTCRFSEPMVPFGDPGLVMPGSGTNGLGLGDQGHGNRSSMDLGPFDIECAEKGAGRWVDVRNWVFDFERTLPAGVLCRFRLKPGLMSLAGNEVTGQNEFSFSTGGPTIVAAHPQHESEGIDESQVFLVVLDGGASEGSMLKYASFSIAGIKGNVGVSVVKGAERKEILKVLYPRSAPPEYSLLLRCRQRFPSGADVSLVWGKGVSTENGVATEQDQVLSFRTREPFSAELRCERASPRSGCIPILPVMIGFNAPVSKADAGRIVMRGPDGKTWKPSAQDAEWVMGVVFEGPFPEKSKLTIEIPPAIKDDAGRALANRSKFPLSFQTGENPPLAKFAARFGILELKAQPVLPVTVRNLEPELKARMLKVDKDPGLLGKITGRVLKVGPDRAENIQGWLKKVAAVSREESLLAGDKEAKELAIPKPNGARAFEVIGIPLDKPGLYVVELESGLLGSVLLESPKPMFVPTAVLVTNLSVHFKWGRESSLVWVTTLDKGTPVGGAMVTVRTCEDKVVWQGKTDGRGIARIGGPLLGESELPACDYTNEKTDYNDMGALSSLGGGLFVTAQAGDDLSFVHSSWNEGIEPWRYSLPWGGETDGEIAHTVFDRTLLRAGETVHMKHIARTHTTKGFSHVSKERMPDALVVNHFGSGQEYRLPLAWDAQGSAVSEWAVPKDAKLGTYGVYFEKTRKGEQDEEVQYGDYWGWGQGQFRVEEFRIPILKGTIKPPADPLINPAEVSLDLGVQYLTGGGAAGTPVKLRAEVRQREGIAFEGYEDFDFGGIAVKEGVRRRGEEIEYGEYEYGEGAGTDSGTWTDSGAAKLPVVDLVLDASGFASAVLSGIPKLERPGELFAEMEFRDPNGETQTVASSVPLWHSGSLVGVKTDSWLIPKDSLKLQVAVVDLSGKPVQGAPVSVELFERKTYSHRKRVVGGFYSYEHTVETRKVAALCEGKTDARGLLICEVKSPVSGNVILQARSADGRGNATFARRDVWVAGKDDWWFEVGDHDRIDLIPEKKRYEPGQAALFQVRAPFREATALVTVEREGVIDAWVENLSGKEPVIKVPVKGSYAPNVFVSALVVRGRAAGVQPTALADLGKPAYKLGIAEIYVSWRDHELKVGVSSDRQVYKVREKVRVTVKVRTADGKAPPKGSEIAIAAVDEGLLELMPNESWGILSAMMGLRGYEVETSTAQTQVIGKRHFGLKALPPGGGGGRQMTRELFDTLLLWKARQPLDAKGDAVIEVPLNDSITGFRIVAVASGGTGLFGSGATSIKSTQDVMVFSGLPPLVREGDRLRAEFTVRNTTKRGMIVGAAAKVEGVYGFRLSGLQAPGPLPLLKPLDLALGPGESKEIAWDVTVPAGFGSLAWEVEIGEKGSASGGNAAGASGSGRTAGGGAPQSADRIRLSQKVVPAVPVRTYQATIAQIEKSSKVQVERPPGALPGRGGVKVTLRPRISAGIEGVKDYMRRYPYVCMEQKVSRAVALRNAGLWERCVADLPAHLDADGLVKYFPTGAYGSPVLSAYILSVADEAGWAIPEWISWRIEDALEGFIEGTASSQTASSRYPFPTADLALQKVAAAEALSRKGKADAQLLSSIPIEPNLWPTSAVIDWYNILQRVGEIPDRKRRISEAEQILRTRLILQGTFLSFSTEQSDRLWWLMVSGDVNAVRLVLALLGSPKWDAEMPRLVMGALARQRRGAWDLTVANAWGALAMEKFAERYEAAAVTGSTKGTLSSASQTLDWPASPDGGTFELPWPPQGEDLALSHQGAGKPWALIQSLAAVPLTEPASSGYAIRKTVTPVEQKRPGRWSRGDVLRVRLDVEAQAGQTWVVVSDPVPAGASILGSGLGRDSHLLTKGEEARGWVWPAYEERSFEAYRVYYEWVPGGPWAFEYTLRLNQGGAFNLPPTRVEALYFPEMFGETPNSPVEVAP